MTISHRAGTRPMPEFVGPAPTDVELAEAELIAAGFTFTVVDTHAASTCDQLPVPAPLLAHAA